MLARHKELYITKYPQTGNGGDRKSQKAERESRVLIPAFTENLSAKTGMSRRSVEEFVQIGDTALSRSHSSRGGCGWASLVSGGRAMWGGLMGTPGGTAPRARGQRSGPPLPTPLARPGRR